MMNISRWYFAILMPAVAISAKGQTTTHADEKPGIEVDGQFLDAKNFPAYSAIEHAILIDHQDFSCCLSSGRFLKKIDVATGKVITKTMLYPHGDSLEITKIDQEDVIHEIQSMVNSKAYKSMIEIDNEHFYLMGEHNGEWIRLGFWMPQLKPREVRILIPPLMLPSYCCGEDFKQLPCKAHFATFNRNKLWIDLKNKIILFAYGSTSDANGCDAGPEYIVKKFK